MRGWAIGIGMTGSGLLSLVCLWSIRATGCEGQPRAIDWNGLLLGMMVAWGLFIDGYAAFAWLARRGWAAAAWGKALCLLPPILTGLASLFLSWLLVALDGRNFC